MAGLNGCMRIERERRMALPRDHKPTAVIPKDNADKIGPRSEGEAGQWHSEDGKSDDKKEKMIENREARSVAPLFVIIALALAVLAYIAFRFYGPT